MDKKTAYRIYGGLLPKNLFDGYKDAQEMVVYNDDPDLYPIPVYLPKPPDWRFIEGFGLPANEQKWKRIVLPDKLQKLSTRKNPDGEYITIEEVWDVLINKYDDYKDEIAWIEKQWYHRLNGFWFFSNGTPTYITGQHYFYLTNVPIDTGYPKYRDRDRRYYLFKEFCLNDTYDFRDKDEKGNAISVGGWFHLIDTGSRVCFGHVYPKMRREGATYREVGDNLEIISRSIESTGGIQSRNEDDAKKVFKKIIRAYKKTWFFFKPDTKSRTDTASILEFDLPSKTSGGASVDTGLQSIISFEDGDPGSYDGIKLIYKHDDEEGKNTKNDIWKKNTIVKECLSLEGGGDIIGYTAKTSTSGEMESGGGEKFFKLCQASHYYSRPTNGQTLSGVYVLFMKSEDGVINDEYGMPVIEDPPKPVKKENGRFTRVGGRSWIQNKADAFLMKNDIEGWAETLRLYPQRYAECFSTAGSEIGFNKKILTNRINELKFRPQTVVGNLIRFNPESKFSKIKFIPDENGRFVVSKTLTTIEANNFYRGQDGMWYPANSKSFGAACDPFKFNQTEDGEMSDGGLAVKWKRDEILDPLSKPIEQWESDRFVLTYRYRTSSKEEFADDCLKACLYFGCPILSESQVPDVIDFFIAWGARPFLKIMRDVNGHWRSTPGVSASETSKDELFKGLRDYIERRGMQERHLDLLVECKEIPSIKKMTKYDLLTACGWCLVGEKSDYGEWMGNNDEEESYDPFDYIMTYN